MPTIDKLVHADLPSISVFKDPRTGRRHCRPVLVAVSFSNNSSAALHLGAQIASATGSGLILTHVLDSDDPARRLREEAFGRLECLASHYDHDFQEIRLRCDQPGPGLINEAVDVHAGMIILGRDENDDLESIGEYVIEHAPCAVAIASPAERGAIPEQSML